MEKKQIVVTLYESKISLEEYLSVVLTQILI